MILVFHPRNITRNAFACIRQQCFKIGLIHVQLNDTTLHPQDRVCYGRNVRHAQFPAQEPRQQRVP
jgi:hypothetical protein